MALIFKHRITAAEAVELMTALADVIQHIRRGSHGNLLLQGCVDITENLSNVMSIESTRQPEKDQYNPPFRMLSGTRGWNRTQSPIR